MLEIQSLYGDTNPTDLTYRRDPGIYWCDSKDFPKDTFNVAERRKGYVVIHFLIMLYMFLALAIICDEYFVPALEEITEKLSLSNDVAGATFMAAGGSAPELFTSLIGVFIADSNVGIGTIVGSAVFNILFVLGMCAFVVGFKTDPQTGKSTILDLTWFPLARDCSFYIIALIGLILFFRSETIEWWESLVLIGIYASYVTFMMYNPKIEAKAVAYFKKKDVAPAETELKEEENQNRWNETANAATGHLHFHTNDPKAVLGIKSDVEVQKTKSDSGIIAAYAVARFSALRRTTMAKSGSGLRPMSVMGTRNELATTPLPIVADEANLVGAGSVNYFEGKWSDNIIKQVVKNCKNDEIIKKNNLNTPKNCNNTQQATTVDLQKFADRFKLVLHKNKFNRDIENLKLRRSQSSPKKTLPNSESILNQLPPPYLESSTGISVGDSDTNLSSLKINTKSNVDSGVKILVEMAGSEKQTSSGVSVKSMPIKNPGELEDERKNQF